MSKMISNQSIDPSTPSATFMLFAFDIPFPKIINHFIDHII